MIVLPGRVQGFMPDIETHAPILGSWGAIGGHWSLPASLYWVSKAWRNVSREVPIIGTNGARSAADVLRFLLSGARLAQFEEWSAVTDLEQTQDEKVFIQASIAQRSRRQAEEAERLSREKQLEHRARVRLRVLLGVMAFAAAIAMGSTHVRIGTAIFGVRD